MAALVVCAGLLGAATYLVRGSLLPPSPETAKVAAAQQQLGRERARVLAELEQDGHRQADQNGSHAGVEQGGQAEQGHGQEREGAAAVGQQVPCGVEKIRL